MVGAQGLEMVAKVAKLADVAWGVQDAHERHRDNDIMERELATEHSAAEEALAKERRENRKLRAAIQAYETALLKELERQGSLQSLAEALHLSRKTSPDLYDELTRKMETPAFLESLKSATEVDHDSLAVVMKTEDDILVTADPEDPNWWLWVNEDDSLESEMKEEVDGLGSEGYIIVDKEDFIDGISNFLARYIISTPQAKIMSPEELQKTILKGFHAAEKKGRLRLLWETGKMLYTATSWGATVFGIYRHPIVIRAASVAVWTTGSLALKMLK